MLSAPSALLTDKRGKQNDRLLLRLHEAKIWQDSKRWSIPLHLMSSQAKHAHPVKEKGNEKATTDLPDRRNRICHSHCRTTAL